ncbi:MAG: T9SS type A sorting domain-containing protein, partial [Bacteroidota bacterium]
DYNVVATDANGCEVEAAIFDVVADVSAIGTNALQLEIFPNPVNESATFNFKSLTGKRVEISIYNMIGEKVMGAQAEINSRHASVTMDVQSLTKGVYWIEVVCESKTYRTEMMKK